MKRSNKKKLDLLTALFVIDFHAQFAHKRTFEFIDRFWKMDPKYQAAKWRRETTSRIFQANKSNANRSSLARLSTDSRSVSASFRSTLETTSYLRKKLGKEAS